MVAPKSKIICIWGLAFGVIPSPTSQSKGLPAIPAGKVCFFITGKLFRCRQSRGQPLTVTLAHE